MTFRSRFTLALMVLSSILCCCNNSRAMSAVPAKNAEPLHACCTESSKSPAKGSAPAKDQDTPCNECPFVAIRANSIVVTTTPPMLSPLAFDVMADLPGNDCLIAFHQFVNAPVSFDRPPPTLLGLHTLLLC